jgi:hypothetical protein
LALGVDANIQPEKTMTAGSPGLSSWICRKAELSGGSSGGTLWQ